MSLGHVSNENMNRTKESITALERDWNWVKYRDSSKDFSGGTETQQQRVKMCSLNGCDLNSLVFHQFAERVIENNPDISASIE